MLDADFTLVSFQFYDIVSMNVFSFVTEKKSLNQPFCLCHRKSPLYDNCFLHAPDNQPLCTCDKKKAKWYLDKGIGGTLDNSM